jgi:hypothetical protein
LFNERCWFCSCSRYSQYRGTRPHRTSNTHETSLPRQRNGAPAAVDNKPKDFSLQSWRPSSAEWKLGLFVCRTRRVVTGHAKSVYNLDGRDHQHAVGLLGVEQVFRFALPIRGQSSCGPANMNSTLHFPVQLKLEPASSTDQEQLGLLLRYREEGSWQQFACVHVPGELRSALASGKVRALHLECLDATGVTRRCLPGMPAGLVMGVELDDGSRAGHVPQQLRRARCLRLVGGSLLCLLGIAALAAAHPWAGALSMLIGSHALRTARSIPHVPFLVHRIQK